MTLTTTKLLVSRFRLIDHGATGAVDYEDGGKDLGQAVSHAVVGLERVMEHVTSPRTGATWSDGSQVGENLIFEIVLGHRSADVLKLAHRARYDSTKTLLLAQTIAKPGHLVKKAGLTTRLQVRPVIDQNSDIRVDMPHLFIPHAYCIAIGPRQYNEREHMMEGTVLTIVGYTDSAGVTHYEGDPYDFPEYEVEP